MDLTNMMQEVAKRMDETRYIHSLGVADEAVRLAERLGADTDKARIAGLLHDITKTLKAEEHLQLCEKFGIIYNYVENSEKKLLHALTGAALAKADFGIEDEEILDAIRCHTTAKPSMSKIALALYLADYTEPNRNYEGVDELRKAVDEDIYKGLLLGLDFAINSVMQKGALLHPDTVEARNWYILEGSLGSWR